MMDVNKELLTLRANVYASVYEIVFARALDVLREIRLPPCRLFNRLFERRDDIFTEVASVVDLQDTCMC